MSRQDMLTYIYETFEPSLFPRLGPGSDALTKKAWDMAYPKLRRDQSSTSDDSLRILDIGCGNGAQTIQLATLARGTITAIDNHQPFLDELWRRVVAAGVSDKITPCLQDMTTLEFDKESFDVVWAEGSLYHAGFVNGVQICHDMLKPGGILAASELGWLKPDLPEECVAFFNEIYPDIDDISAKVDIFRNAGFEAIEHFALPEESWWGAFYTPLQQRVNTLREKYSDDHDWIAILDSFQHEIDVFSRYSEYYGSVMYVMRRK